MSPCTRVEAIEYSKPYSDDLRPPDRLKNIILSMAPHQPLLITGHSINPELIQKVEMRCKRWVDEHNVTAGDIELAQPVNIYLFVKMG